MNGIFKGTTSCFQYDEDTSSKAIHNFTSFNRLLLSLFSIWRRYKFESNSQLNQVTMLLMLVVFNMTKIQVRKQFTTSQKIDDGRTQLFSIWRRYKFESNSQLESEVGVRNCRCFQYDEDTSSKAIHNVAGFLLTTSIVVFNMTKIQVRKQFTTATGTPSLNLVLFSIWRRYKFESNSQQRLEFLAR